MDELANYLDEGRKKTLIFKKLAMENLKGISFIWKSRASHYPSWSSRYFVLTI